MSARCNVVLVSVEDVENTASLLKYMLNISEDKAKEICENLPYTIYEDVPKQEAIRADNTLTPRGAKLDIIEIEDDVLYKIIINRCDPISDDKVKLIKALRDIMHIWDLKLAKQMIDATPITILESTTLDYAKNIEKQFDNYGLSSYITIEEM